MISDPIRDQIWKEMLTAELTQLYWEKLGHTYRSYDRNSKIFLAISTSSTVASWTLWVQVDILWKILSGLSALIAIVVPVLRWEYFIEKTSELKEGWLDVSHEYQNLWLKVETKSITSDKSVLKIRDDIFRKEKSLDSKSSSLPRDRKLIELCDDEIRTRRGLPLSPRKGR